MGTPRDIRRLAFQALYQIDARGTDDLPSILESLNPAGAFTEDERGRALALALAAFENRGAADAEMLVLAPTWPAHRQPAVDRAVLRLAHYEMVVGRAPPKVVVNEAVELAKEFSTDKAPAFVNGLLDKVLKRVLAERSVSAVEPVAGAETEGGA
ncbi:MAG: transcription antitermination factor NusB [Phycisphaerales bacterium]|nr:transcription antitermination factor NusB [Phycisphaerales bacterium]